MKAYLSNALSRRWNILRGFIEWPLWFPELTTLDGGVPKKVDISYKKEVMRLRKIECLCQLYAGNLANIRSEIENGTYYCQKCYW